ncbi:hypothetical protein GGI20_005945, partial [Coemansia sp. BCRC 34301]
MLEADRQEFDDGVYASRVFTMTRFVLWASSSPENRRVLLHHGALVCVRETLATMRKCRADVFGEDMLELLDPEFDSDFVPDVRSFDWASAAQASADAYMAPGAACQAEPTTKAAGSILFRLLMLLNVRLLDPEAKFAEYLQCACTVEAESEFTIVDANEGAKDLLSELLLAWQRLEVAPSRPRLGQAVFSLSSAIGSVLVSGRVDGHQLRQLHVAEIIARPMHWLQHDEAYVAWRLLILLAEQHAEFAEWSRDILTKVSGFWQACTLNHTEYLRSYVSLYHAQPAQEQEAAISPDDRASLDAILIERYADPLDSSYFALQRCIHIHTRDEFIDSAVRPAILQKYVKTTGCSVETDTRLRRAFDTIVACLAQHESHLPLPSYIWLTLVTINQLIESATTGTDQIVAAKSCEPGAVHYEFLLTEYVQFLWSVWQLPLCLDIMSAVFSSISAAVWDSMLSRLAAQNASESSSAMGPEHVADQVPDIIHQRILMLAGWLLMHSSPSSSDGGYSMLSSPVCKLVFRKVMAIMSRGADSTFALGSALTSSKSHDSEALELGEAASLAAYRASQCMLLICWHDIRRFRLLIHETQSTEYMLGVLYHLDILDKRLSGAQSTGYVTRSLENLSVVSLPDESVWNLADSKSLVHRPRWVAERLLGTTLFLFWASTADSCSACKANFGSVPRGESALLESDKKSQAQMFRIIWQLCHTPVHTHPFSAEPIDCLSVLSAMSTSGNVAVSM